MLEEIVAIAALISGLVLLILRALFTCVKSVQSNFRLDHYRDSLDSQFALYLVLPSGKILIEKEI